MEQFLSNGYWLLLSAIGGWIGWEIRSARKDIEKLNIMMATIIERVSIHEVRITRIEEKAV